MASFRALSRAAAKSASARLRRMGLLAQGANWAARATVCESCPVRVVRRGISYCGKPLLEDLHRDPTDGCGCPTRDKAKDPAEHCPLDRGHRLARLDDVPCNCKWCDRAGACRPGPGRHGPALLVRVNEAIAPVAPP